MTVVRGVCIVIGSHSLKHKVAKAVRRQFISRPNRSVLPSVDCGPVVVAGLFSTGSGIGQSARACYRALEKSGVDCYALDLSASFNQVDLSSDIPTISTLPPGRQGTIILHLNGPETQHGLYHAGLLIGRQWRIIGYWAWELLEPPTGWAEAAQHLSEIWTPSEFVKNGVEPIVDIPVRVVPHYISTPSMKAGDPPLDVKNGLTFLTMADGYSSFHRKNLHGAIKAYTNAFEESADHQLVIKCRNLSKYTGVREDLYAEIGHREDVHLIDETYHEDEMWKLLHAADVVLSMHRSEGFGLHLAEAMALGKVAVGTNWSGNLSFMTPENSVLVSSELVDLRDPTGIYSQFEGAKWAEASVDCAVEQMRSVAQSESLRSELGARAKADISRQLSPQRYVEALGVPPFPPADASIPAFAE